MESSVASSLCRITPKDQLGQALGLLDGHGRAVGHHLSGTAHDNRSLELQPDDRVGTKRLLLFHQAGSSKAEYAPIAPRLVADGYSALAVDARAGGDLYGANETVKALGHSADYAAARADLQAAVDWAQGQGVPVLIWGSSYSSALVFPLGAANAGKVAGVLAFSPSEYIGGGDPVKRAAAALKVPVFITSAGDAEEHGAAAAIAARVAPERVTLYRPAAGVHGSSSLRQDRNPRGWQANFAAVEAWLGKVVP